MRIKRDAIKNEAILVVKLGGIAITGSTLQALGAIGASMFLQIPVFIALGTISISTAFQVFHSFKRKNDDENL